MAQRFTGIEVGERSVRAVRLSRGARGLVADTAVEEPYAAQSEDEGGLRGVLRKLSLRPDLQADIVALSVPTGPELVTRIDLPFEDEKVIEQVLPNQLTGKWPADEGRVVAFTVLGKKAGPEPLFDVLVLGYPAQLAQGRIALLSGTRLEPHIALPLQLAEVSALRFLTGGRKGCSALLDLGETTSLLTVADGEDYVMSRLQRVGGKQITLALAREWSLDESEAERVKQRCAFVAPEGQEDAWFARIREEGGIEPCAHAPAQVAALVRESLKPLLLGLRQSLNALRHQHGKEIEVLHVAGGAARLPGVVPFLSRVLNIDCRPVRLDTPALSNLFPDPLAHPQLIGALALALVGAESESQSGALNLRRGVLAYKGTLEFLREKMWTFVALAGLLLAAVIFMIATQHHAQTTEHARLKEALGKATEQLLGTQLYSLTEIQTAFERARGFGFIPERTAFDHFEWISNRFHDSLADVEFELEAIEIETMRKTVTIKGEVAGDEGLPMMMSVLERYDCFPSEIPNPRTQKVRGRVSFQLRIEAHHCYGAAGDEE